MMGDKAEVYKTELLRKNPFPEFENESIFAVITITDTIRKIRAVTRNPLYIDLLALLLILRTAYPFICISSDSLFLAV